jgi:hypothetical protein
METDLIVLLLKLVGLVTVHLNLSSVALLVRALYRDVQILLAKK